MSAASPDVCESGSLLADLERRQDDVLAQLDALDRQLTSILKGLGVTLIDDAEPTAAAAEGDEDEHELAGAPAARSGQDGPTLPWPTGGFAKLPAEPGAADSDQTRAA